MAGPSLRILQEEAQDEMVSRSNKRSSQGFASWNRTLKGLAIRGLIGPISSKRGG